MNLKKPKRLVMWNEGNTNQYLVLSNDLCRVIDSDPKLQIVVISATEDF